MGNLQNNLTTLARRLKPYLIQQVETIIQDQGDPNAIHDNVSGEINAITEKATPADADLVIIEDSAASYAKKKVQVSNIGGGGISAGSWTSYGGTSTINGFSSMTESHIYYKVVDDVVFFAWRLSGSADGSAVMNFTLPFGIEGNMPEYAGWMRAYFSGAWSHLGNWAMFDQGGGVDNVVELYPDAAQSSGWPGSGTIRSRGQGWYIKAA